MKILRLNPYSSSTSKTSAFFDVITSEGITIKGFTLVDGSNGLFVNCPSEKGKDGKYYEKVILPKELKEELTALAINEYNNNKGNPSQVKEPEEAPF